MISQIVPFFRMELFVENSMIYLVQPYDPPTFVAFLFVSLVFASFFVWFSLFILVTVVIYSHFLFLCLVFYKDKLTETENKE